MRQSPPGHPDSPATICREKKNLVGWEAIVTLCCIMCATTCAWASSIRSNDDDHHRLSLNTFGFSLKEFLLQTPRNLTPGCFEGSFAGPQPFVSLLDLVPTADLERTVRFWVIPLDGPENMYRARYRAKRNPGSNDMLWRILIFFPKKFILPNDAQSRAP